MISLYLHIPFCIHRCGYCDFNTYAGIEELIPAYATALIREIEFLSERRPGLPVHTVFFGGGTPSLLPESELERILLAIADSFDLQPMAEISLEANPGTLSPAYLQGLQRLGINRLSLGVQSANPTELRLLERQHHFSDVIESVNWARQAGFTNLNLDLIFGLPAQALVSWQNTLKRVLPLRPEHFSLYALSLEHGTPFGHWTSHGLLSSPDPDRAAEMYELAAEQLDKAGYAQYEISNWAADSRLSLKSPPAARQLKDFENPGLACQHNLQYWHNLPYLGLGAGAHGFADGLRTANTLSPQAYIRSLTREANIPSEPTLYASTSPDPQYRQHPSTDAEGRAAPPGEIRFPLTPAAQSSIPIDRDTEIGETMMMGLRLVREGVSDATFTRRFGQSLKEVFPTQIARLQDQGLLTWAGPQDDRLRLTPRGILLGNRVFSEFI